MSRYTYQDAAEHGIDYVGGTSDAQMLRDVRRACLESYRELTNARTWSFLMRHGRVVTSAPYLTGFVAYDQTGGTYERQVLLSGGTWPDWAGPGSQIRVGTVVSQVAERRSGTDLTLSDQVNFGSDINLSRHAITTLTLPGAAAITALTHAAPAVLTVAAHGLTTGDSVLIKDVGTTNTANPVVTLNGTWTVTVLTSSTFSLDTSSAASDTTWDGVGSLVRFPLGVPVTVLTRAHPAVLTSVAHGLTTGDLVVVSGVTSAASPAVVTANGTWAVTVLTADTFSLTGSDTSLDTAYSATGVWHRPTLITSSAHGLTTGTALAPTRVVVEGVLSTFRPLVSDVITSNGTWSVTVVDADTFALNGSNGLADTTWDTASGTWRTYPTTTFTLYRDTYVLPTDFVAQDTAIYEGNFGGLEFCDATSILWTERVSQQTGTPRFYSIQGNPLFPGRMTVVFSPYPDQSRTIDFTYHRRPRPLATPSYAAGSVTTAAGSAVVTGNGTAWTAAMAGAVLRTGTASVSPTSEVSTAPAVFESVVLEVLSATSLRVADAVPLTYAAVLYVISDPIDFEPGVMLTAFLRGVEKQLAIARTMTDKPDAFASYSVALKEAMAADSRSFQGRAMGPGRNRRTPMKYWPATFNP